MHTCICLFVKFFQSIRYVHEKNGWFVEMEFNDGEELRNDIKVYILHMIVFYRRILKKHNFDND